MYIRTDKYSKEAKLKLKELKRRRSLRSQARQLHRSHTQTIAFSAADIESSASAAGGSKKRRKRKTTKRKSKK